MRGSGWIIGLVAFAIWCTAIAVPATIVSIVALAAADPQSSAADLGVRHLGALWRSGLLWGASVGVAAAILGWLPGRVLRALAVRNVGAFAVVGVLLLVPAALPAYLGSWCWWQLAPPDSDLGAWIIRSGHAWWLRHAILALGLVGWAWPLAAWTVAGLGSASGSAVADALRLDGASCGARLRLAWHEDRTALLLAATFTGIFVFGNTTAFDLALVRSFGFELRTLEVRGAGVGATVRAAMPAIMTALVAIGVSWALLQRAGRGVTPHRHCGAGASLFTAIVAIVGIGVPLTLLLRAVPLVERGGDFVALYGAATRGSIAVALGVGATAAVVAAGAVTMHSDRRAWVRATAETMLLGWAIAAAVPATVVATALIASFNRGVLARTIYDSPVIVLLGHLACFGFVAALLGRQAVRAAPATLIERRTLDGGGTLVGTVRSLRPVLIAAAGASAALVSAMSLGEVVVASRLQPPGFDSIASALLNAVHYQRPETVMIGALLLLLLALFAAVAIMLAWVAVARLSAWRRSARGPDRGGSVRSGRITTVLVASAATGMSMIMLPGCGRLDAASPPPIPTRTMFGRPGVGGGQFDYPRAIAVDAVRERVYVIDKTARIQRFDFDGTLGIIWRMPEWQAGKPVGLAVAPDGAVWVADTHYYRVVVFESDGTERLRFGRFGHGDGEFVYPTDVAFGADGRVYVSEYGGNDRIQVFDPTGRFLFAFGAFGDGPGEFSRPQAITFNVDGTELLVADSCNHRIIAFDPEGRPLRVFGRVGTGLGELGYPYGIEVLADGTVMVVEFGNSRVQRFSIDGTPLGIWGGVGFDRGRTRSPWGLAAGSSTIFVLDSGNHRVQAMRRP